MPLQADIVIPIYNEAATVEAVTTRLRRACPDANLIFVDNASTDETVAALERLGVPQIIRHTRNLGYGRSLSDGIQAARSDIVIIIDADLEYYPEDIPRLLAQLESSPAVLGSRLLAPGQGGLPWIRSLGNRVVTGLFNLLFRQHITDLYTGLRGVRRSALPRCRWRTSGFEFVIELSARLAQAGVQLAEVPIRYAPRTTGRSKMRHVPEFLKFCFYLLYFRLTPGSTAREV